MPHSGVALVLAALAAVAAASSAEASQRVSVARAVDADCGNVLHRGAGTTERAFRARKSGYLTARLHARSGDWDLAVFRRGERQPVAASAYSGATEVAGGFVRRGDRLVLRACRRTGPAGSARVGVAIERLGREARERVTVVRVATPTLALRRRLGRLGFDIAEETGSSHTAVLLHGRDDGARLRRAGFRYSRARAARSAPQAHAAALPSGPRSTYRRLADYGLEMKALASGNPDIVRPITLPLTSHQGRVVEGLEITTSPNARDGKPVYLQVGLHHAREWPSGEHTLEWAYDLIAGYRAGDPRTVSLVDRVRTIVVPVVNPDGFNFSREAGQSAGHGGGDTGFDGSSAEYHRKNCAPSGCAVSGGVDLNRNYGDLWGGPGTSSSPSLETYRGTAPFSEPEAENIRRLISSRQVVMLISNHTFGNEILRQPGYAADGPTPDEPLLGSVGAAMAAENGYSNIFSYEIGDHVGTTDGWSYYTTGGLAYVIEQAPSAFHPPYAQTVAHYDGSSVPGGGTREAFFVAMGSAANAAHHAVLTGGAPAGAILRLGKAFQNRTWTGTTSERFDTTMQVPASGRFEWHVNQSARPLVPGETWTLSCELPEGTPLASQQVAVTRGQSLELGSVCGPGGPPPDLRPVPTVRVVLAAVFDGRRYRVKVSGALRNVPDLERCDGPVRIALLARGKTVLERRPHLDERCRFAWRVSFRRRALPRSLRGRRARPVFRAVVRWTGNEFLAPANKSVTKRVRRVVRRPG
jgi:hypothetical protein